MRPGIGLATLVCALTVIASPADAGTTDDAEAVVERSGDTIVATVSVDGDTVGQRVGGDPLAGCAFLVGLTGAEVIEYLGARGVVDGITTELLDGGAGDGGPGDTGAGASFAFVSCPRPFQADRSWLVWAEGDPVPRVVLDALARSARASIVVPALAPASAPDGFDTPYLVNLPVWLWVDDDQWQPLSATAAIVELGVSVTVVAEPATTRWDAGNGTSPIECSQGTPWEPGLTDDQSSCSIVHDDVTDEATLSVTVRFEVEVSCQPVALCTEGDGLAVEPVNMEATRTTRVTEAWGVLTG